MSYTDAVKLLSEATTGKDLLEALELLKTA